MNKRNIRTYGRIKGRGDTPHYTKYLDEFILHDNDIVNKDSLYLEIGFGMGDFLINKAKNNLDKIFIGCEVYINGINSLIAKAKEKEINNIKIWPNDVRDLLETIKDNSVKMIWILFPDPWPKKRHNKRRLINRNFLEILKSKLLIGGKIFIATDIYDYADSISANAKGLFKINNDAFESEYIKTSYHNKSSTAINYIMFEK